ncbi:MAG: transglutaminase-like domain-containing protein, partial [archaeon]
MIAKFNEFKKNNLFNIIIIAIIIQLFFSFGFCLDTNNSLEFSAMKAKFMDIDINMEIPIVISNYNEGLILEYSTFVFANSRNQIVNNLEAYYFDSNNNKAFAVIKDDNFGNKIAVFKITNLQQNNISFFINANIKSENKSVLSNLKYNLTKEILENSAYKLSSEYIQSDASEIKTVLDNIKESDDAITELVNITNWVHQNIAYDLSYGDEVYDSLTTLKNKKGVCDELAILEAAFL